MKLINVFLLFLILIFFTSSLMGDSWSSPEKRKIFSASMEYIFEIIPSESIYPKPGTCMGILYKINDNKKAVVWSRYLINNRSPVNALVSNSGNYIVTFDEWHEAGDLPVVIYGHDGRLIYAHSIESLGLDNDVMHIEQTISSYWWNKNAINFFGPDEQFLFIRLHWGKLLIIRLQTGSLINSHKDLFSDSKNKWKKLQAYARKMINKKALELLKSKTPGDKKTGALVAGQLKIKKAIPLLRKLLKDNTCHSTTSFKGNIKSSKIVYEVRKKAKTALELMGEVVTDVVTEEPYEFNSR